MEPLKILQTPLKRFEGLSSIFKRFVCDDFKTFKKNKFLSWFTRARFHIQAFEEPPPLPETPPPPDLESEELEELLPLPPPPPATFISIIAGLDLVCKELPPDSKLGPQSVPSEQSLPKPEESAVSSLNSWTKPEDSADSSLNSWTKPEESADLSLNSWTKLEESADSSQNSDFNTLALQSTF